MHVNFLNKSTPLSNNLLETWIILDYVVGHGKFQTNHHSSLRSVAFILENSNIKLILHVWLRELSENHNKTLKLPTDTIHINNSSRGKNHYPWWKREKKKDKKKVNWRWETLRMENCFYLIIGKKNCLSNICSTFHYRRCILPFL